MDYRFFLLFILLSGIGGFMTLADAYPVWQDSMEQAAVIGQNQEGIPITKVSPLYILQVMVMDEEYIIHSIEVSKDFFYSCPTGSSISKPAQSFSFVCETKEN